VELIDFNLLDIPEENSFIGLFVWSHTNQEKHINRPLPCEDIIEVFADTIETEYPEYIKHDGLR
jgi:hypothetical protein